MRKKLHFNLSKVLFLLVLLAGGTMWGQTISPVFDMATGNYTFTGFASGTTTAYPSSMQGYEGNYSTANGVTSGSSTTVRPMVVNTNSISTASIRNEVSNGVSMLASGSTLVGGIYVAIKTTGRTNIKVSWTAGQLTDVATRVNGMRLQYRTATSGSFINVPGTDFLTALDGTGGMASDVSFTDITLPTGANDKTLVQLRWVYYDDSTTSGSRDRIKLDDITITSSNFATTPILAISGSGTAGSTCPNVATGAITYTINNTGGGAAEGIVVASSNPQFVVSAPVSTTIAGNSSTTFTLTFTPTSAGTKSSNITVTSTSTGSNSPQVTIEGIGTSSVTPNVTNNVGGANNITTNGATLRGVIGAVGVCPNSTERGFVYSKGSDSVNPVSGNANVITAPYTATSLTNNGYTLAVTGLVPGTQYYYRSYILTDGIYSYAPPISFTTTAATATAAGTLNESTLNGAVLTVNLTGDTYTASITASAFTLTGAPAGVTVASATLNNSTQAAITLSYDGTDFDSDLTNFRVNINNSVLSSSTSPIITSNRTVTAVNESITAAPTSLSNINYVINNGPSAVKEFTVSSTALGAGGGTITFTAPTNYEIANTNNNASFGSTTSLVYTGTGTFSPNKLYVRLKAGLPIAAYNSEVITASGGKLTAPYNFATVSGSVTTTPPANDNCDGAIALTMGASAISGTTSGATDSGIGIVCNGLVGGDNDDVWYSFNTTVAATYTIQVIGSASFDAVLDLRSGLCNSTSSVSCVENTSGGGTETLSAALAANTTYFVRIYHYDTDAPATNTFTIRVTAPAATLYTNGTTALSFPTTNITTSSANQTFNVSGISLTGAPGVVTITSSDSSNFKVSNDGSTWGASTTVAYSASDLYPTIVYVQFVPQTPGLKSGSLTISGGGASVSPTVTLSGTAIVPAPVANEETGLTVGGTGFTANWDEVSGATGYYLDVSTTNTFEDASSVVSTEGFEGTFPPAGWASSGWSKSTTSGDFKNGLAAAVGGSTNGTLTTAAYSHPSSLSFYLGRSSNTTVKTLTVEVSTTSASSGFVTIATYDHTNIPVSSYNQYTLDLSAYSASANVYIRFTKSSSTTSPWRLDDVSVASNTNVPYYVAGYQNLSVGNVTSHAVTGLTLGNTYYYRVRAVSANSTSANSNVIDAVAVETNFWTGAVSNEWTNGANWSLGVVPTAADYASITGGANNPEIGAGMTVNVYQLLVQAGGAMNIAPETTLHVEDVITVETGGSLTVADGGSLIQVNDVDNLGNATVLKNSNPLYRYDYTVWSSPVIGQTLQDFSPLTQAGRFYEYGINPDTGNEAYIAVPSSEAFEPGKGYLIRTPHHLESNDPDYAAYDIGTAPYTHEGEYEGNLINGDVTVPLSTQANFVSMVGNPYASPINVAEFFDYNEDVLSNSAGIYFWRKRNNTEATSYATLTKTSYAANDGGVESEDGNYQSGGQQWEDYYDTVSPSSWVIAAGQGFFVQGNGAAGNLTFKNVMRRSAQAGQPFFRMDNNNQLSRLWLNLYSEANFSQTSIAYTEGATLGVDYGMDARKFSNPNVSLYSVMGADNFTIQTRPAFEDTDVVPMGYNVNTAGTYTISLHRKDGVFEAGQNVYLKDTQLDVIHNFNEGLYTFATEAGTFNERFQVIYSDGALGINNPIANSNTVVVYNKENVLNVHAGNIQITAITVYDLRGRVLYTATDINSTEAAINMQPQQQVLLVEVNTANGKVTKKVVY